MKERIRTVLRHPVTVNALAMYAGQFAVTVLPLVVLPYLARVLGPAQLGVVIFVQYFSFLLGALLEYGFGFSATREVARARENPEALSRTVADVMGAKLLLSAACAGISILAWPLFPVFRDAPELLVLGVVLTFGQGLFPIWFYAGLERLRLPTAVEFVTRLAAAAGIFLLVDGREDTDLVLGIYAAVTVGSTLFLHVLLYRGVQARRPSFAGAMRALRAGSALFVSTASVTLYSTVGVLLLGLFVPASQVGYFAGAEKIVRAAQRVLGSAAGAVYPRVSYLVGAGRDERAHRLALLALVSVTAVATVAAFCLILLAEPVVEIVYGSGFAPTVPVLRILAATIPLAILAALVSTLWLLPHGLDRTVTRIVIISCTLDVVLLSAAAPLAGVEAAALALLAVEAVTLAAMVVSARRAGVLRPGGVASVRPAPVLDRAEYL
jgi:PST family polysaccharide transporter